MSDQRIDWREMLARKQALERDVRRAEFWQVRLARLLFWLARRVEAARVRYEQSRDKV